MANPPLHGGRVGICRRNEPTWTVRTFDIMAPYSPTWWNVDAKYNSPSLWPNLRHNHWVSVNHFTLYTSLHVSLQCIERRSHECITVFVTWLTVANRFLIMWSVSPSRWIFEASIKSPRFLRKRASSHQCACLTCRHMQWTMFSIREGMDRLWWVSCWTLFN